MKKTLFIVLALVALLALAGAVAAQPTNFRAHMSAAPGINSNGQGQTNFQLNGNELSFIMPVSRLNGATTAAHIHYSADPGGNGPPRISLCGAFGPPPIPVADCGGPGNPARATVTLTEAQVNELMTAIAENRAYVNVHTTFAPPGEIRGQVVIAP